MGERVFQSPDQLDCILELHLLKEYTKRIDNEKLIDNVIEFSSDIELDAATEQAVAFYFNKGYLTDIHRNNLENCYVILNNSTFFDPEGNIYQSMTYIK